ncbi:MAG: hypothetical protein AB7V36_04000 [Bacteroidales bacterium]
MKTLMLFGTGVVLLFIFAGSDVVAQNIAIVSEEVKTTDQPFITPTKQETAAGNQKIIDYSAIMDYDQMKSELILWFEDQCSNINDETHAYSQFKKMHQEFETALGTPTERHVVIRQYYLMKHNQL